MLEVKWLQGRWFEHAVICSLICVCVCLSATVYAVYCVLMCTLVFLGLQTLTLPVLADGIYGKTLKSYEQLIKKTHRATVAKELLLLNF